MFKSCKPGKSQIGVQNSEKYTESKILPTILTIPHDKRWVNLEIVTR